MPKQIRTALLEGKGIHKKHVKQREMKLKVI
jgi:hypothetical protein